jgi:lipopolysaccharide export system protein LptC
MKFTLRHLAIAATLAVLAAGSWWLTLLTNETEATFDGKQRHDPDLIAEGFHSVVMTAGGVRQYELRGERMVHFGDDGSSEVERPYFIQYVPGRAATHARAREGFVPEGSAYIRFRGDVHVAQGRDPKSAGGDVRTGELTVNLDRSR